MKFVSLLFVGQLLLVLINGSDVTDRGRRVVCYYIGIMDTFNISLIPEDIDPSLCTHLIYLNGQISHVTDEIVPQNATIALFDNGGHGFYNRTAKLKELNPQLKVLLHVFRKSIINQISMIRERRSTFIRSAVSILQTHGFDGLDLDTLIHPDENENHFTLLLSELRSEFDKYGFIIATSLPEFDFPVNESREMDVITRCSDFIIIRTIGESSREDNVTKLYHPLADVKSAIDVFLAENVPPEKLLIMIPAMGTISQLKDVNDTKIGAPMTPLGFDHSFKRSIFYHELVKRFANQSENWNLYRDEVSHAPYASNKDGLWVSYEDTVSVGDKARYVVENKLGGAAILTLDTDDVSGAGGEGTFSLTRKVGEIIAKREKKENHS